MKRKIFLLAALIVLGAALVLAALIFLFPERWFRVTDSVARAFASAELAELDPLTLELEPCNADLVREDQSLLLINSDHPIGSDFEARICEYKDSGLYFNECITEAYSALSSKIKTDFGIPLYVMSAYRTEEEQIEAIDKEGENAAPVGQSEHQSGLALDVYVSMFAGAGFLKSEVGRYVNANSWRYGFIIRYPYYAQEQTEMGYEPWHIRYVGMPHAEIIYKNSLSLEEYIESLEIGKYYGYNGYIITRQKDIPVMMIKDRTALISRDNTGAYIITYERQ